MPSTLAAVAVAALALITQTIAVTPAEANAGRIQGFTAGPESSWTSDFLLSTFCFCAVQTPIPQQYSEAHYLQFEYYNKHQNKTYIINHLCIEDQDSEVTCLAPRLGDDMSYKETDWEGEICKQWHQGDEYDHRSHEHFTDRMCYKPDRSKETWREYRIPGRDQLKFNHQKRNLDERGTQGAQLKSREEAEETCHVLCWEHANMPVLVGNERAVSHIVAYTDMDDMCGDCE